MPWITRRIGVSVLGLIPCVGAVGMTLLALADKDIPFHLFALCYGALTALTALIPPWPKEPPTSKLPPPQSLN